MNKKFSTLMAGFLLAGGLSSFANAETLKASIGKKVKTVESGSTYFFIENSSSAPTYAYGVKKEQNGNYTELVKAASQELTKEEMENYLWEVYEVPYSTNAGATTQFGYALKNKATGKFLTFADEDGDQDAEIVWADEYKATDANTFIAITYVSGQDFAKYDGTKPTTNFWIGDYTTYGINCYLDLTGGGLDGVASSSASDFSFYEVADTEVPSTDLNALYNSAGFNLKLDDGDVANVFDNGKTIKAVGIKAGTVLTKDGAVYTSTNPEYGFPAGTYFLSETPAGKVPTNEKELYSYLLNSTFVALSPSVNADESGKVKASGEGFTLVDNVAGKDLNLYLGQDKNFVSSGDQVSVKNAAFTVMNNATNKDVYALSVAGFRFKGGADATHTEKTVGLAIKSAGTYGGSKFLVSDPNTGNNNRIFKFVESTIKKGIDLLNANGASVYNIKFVGGKVDGYYLTNAYDGNAYKNFAKGTVLSDPTTPAFQYVITKVDGNDVTFTNRETDKTFTAKLFDKGGNKYTLALTKAEQSTKYDILDVQNNGDVKNINTEDLHLSEVELVPVTSVDKFAGFMDEANEARVSLTFARDEDPTSNKLYPLVKEDPVGTFSWNNMTDEVSEGAVWQLVKSEKPNYKTLTYAYINANNAVDYKNLGDTVAYYTYKFQYVKDGVLKNLYINNSNLSNSALPNAGTDYIVKENVNGSVSIVTKYADDYTNTKYPVQAFYYPYQLVVTSYNSVTTPKPETNRTLTTWAISQESNATDIKAYIVLDAPEVTLPTTASYITMKDEVGNLSLGIDNERDVVYAKDDVTIRVFATDKDKEIPSFFVTTGWNKEDGSRMFLMNPSDSVDYKVGAGKYDKNYQWNADMTKAIFKSAKLNASLDTLTTSITGKTTKVAMKADNAGVQGGLDYFKYQIFLADAEEADDLYIVRTLADAEGGRYLCQLNGKFGWSKDRDNAIKFRIADVDAPTANESINAANNVIVAGVNGAVVVKGAEGKNVIVSTILGKVVANEVVSSDNATIAAPQGVVVVSVDGESFKVVVK